MKNIKIQQNNVKVCLHYHFTISITLYLSYFLIKVIVKKRFYQTKIDIKGE